MARNAFPIRRIAYRIAYPIGKTVTVTVASFDSSPAKSRILYVKLSEVASDPL